MNTNRLHFLQIREKALNDMITKTQDIDKIIEISNSICVVENQIECEKSRISGKWRKKSYKPDIDIL